MGTPGRDHRQNGHGGRDGEQVAGLAAVSTPANKSLAESPLGWRLDWGSHIPHQSSSPPPALAAAVVPRGCKKSQSHQSHVWRHPSDLEAVFRIPALPPSWSHLRYLVPPPCTPARFVISSCGICRSSCQGSYLKGRIRFKIVLLCFPLRRHVVIWAGNRLAQRYRPGCRVSRVQRALVPKWDWSVRDQTEGKMGKRKNHWSACFVRSTPYQWSVLVVRASVRSRCRRSQDADEA